MRIESVLTDVVALHSYSFCFDTITWTWAVVGSKGSVDGSMAGQVVGEMDKEDNNRKQNDELGLNINSEERG